MSEEERASRSAKKRAAKAVEALARQLVEMPEAEWQKLPASAAIREELELARSTRGHGARKRQTKHLAGLLRRREDEAEALQDFLEGFHQTQLQKEKAFHDLEDLRDRLCAPATFAEALEEVQRRFPATDGATLTHLAHSVHATGDRKAFREIFRQLRKAKGT